MGENSKIEWTDATVNFWIGCTRVSPACDRCYAEAFSKRTGRAKWGHGEARSRCKGAVALAMKLERQAVREGRRLRVFANSMSDFFDAEVPDDWRNEALAAIALTPNLDWLLLTKRPQVARTYLRERYSEPHANVWLGTTVENQDMLDLRWPILRDIPAAVHFLSMEPLLGPAVLPGDFLALGNRAWCISGGESGPGARPSHPDWFRALRDQCAAAGTPYLFKQWGDWIAGGHQWSPDHDGVSSADKNGVYFLPKEPSASHEFDDGEVVFRVGKKAAGRLLDGVQHDGVPG